uniref:Reverse transcriptase n=1 Tax=Solanum tuberosum TaxID=4113 RepID=M1D5Q8_SOLTU
MNVMEMKMLRWMGSHTRLDKIRNDHIHKKVQVTHIEEKIREGHLRWYVYVLH